MIERIIISCDNCSEITDLDQSSLWSTSVDDIHVSLFICGWMTIREHVEDVSPNYKEFHFCTKDCYDQYLSNSENG